MVEIDPLAAPTTYLQRSIRTSCAAFEQTAITQLHEHQTTPLLKPPGTAATAAPDRATPLSATTHDRSIPPPSRACRAAPAWRSPYRWLGAVQPVPGANWYGATQNCGRPGTAPVAGPTRFRFYTAWRCAVQ